MWCCVVGVAGVVVDDGSVVVDGVDAAGVMLAVLAVVVWWVSWRVQ